VEEKEMELKRICLTKINRSMSRNRLQDTHKRRMKESRRLHDGDERRDLKESRRHYIRY
jgi:hypothetical protein